MQRQRPAHNPAEDLLRQTAANEKLFLRPDLSAWRSDHCSGDRFFNPGPRVSHGAADALKWLATRKPAPWPRWVDANEPSVVPADSISEDLNDWRVTFINHATVLLQIGPWNLLTDPVWSDRCSPSTRLGPRRVRLPGLRLDQLPPIHAVLLSHDHYDHLDLRTLMWLAKRDQMPIVTGLGVGALLRANGVEHVVELDWWQQTTLGPLTLHFLPAQHFSGRGARDRNRTLWGSLWVDTPFGAAYFAGDTGYGPHFSEIQQRMGSPRLALLPIGAYAPRWFMSPVHMCPHDAVRAHKDLQATRSLAIHFNTFQLTDEAMADPVHELSAALTQQAVASSDFKVLAEGQVLDA